MSLDKRDEVMDVARIIPDLDDDELEELVEVDQEASGREVPAPEVEVAVVDGPPTEPSES